MATQDQGLGGAGATGTGIGGWGVTVTRVRVRLEQDDPGSGPEVLGILKASRTSRKTAAVEGTARVG
jgi:hypothetical protein